MKPTEVKAIREKLGLTQLQLGQKLELSGPAPDRVIRRWEADGVSGAAAVALRLLLQSEKKRST